jgi:hypothetical protein
MLPMLRLSPVKPSGLAGDPVGTFALAWVVDWTPLVNRTAHIPVSLCNSLITKLPVKTGLR